jgi:hypothetical protein
MLVSKQTYGDAVVTTSQESLLRVFLTLRFIISGGYRVMDVGCCIWTPLFVGLVLAVW